MQKHEEENYGSDMVSIEMVFSIENTVSVILSSKEMFCLRAINILQKQYSKCTLIKQILGFTAANEDTNK